MKNSCGLRVSFVVAFLILLLASSCSKKQNWPQFRGPESNMVPIAQSLPEEWGVDKNVRWTADLDGKGYSSPIIWGNKVIITSAVGEKMNPVPERGPMPGPQPGQGPRPGQMPMQPEVRDTSYKQEIYRLEVICFDLATGNEIWKKTAYRGAPKSGKNTNSTYACETPVTDGKSVFASFGMNGLFCYDMEGNLLWQKDFGPYYTQRGWGTGSSPVLNRDVLFILMDNEENSFITALDAATGEEKWKVQRNEKTTYSTPYIWMNKIRTELVVCGKTARSYDPETGKLFWEMKAGGEQVIPSPVGNEEFLYLGAPGGREIKGVLYAVKAGLDGDISSTGIVWKTEESGIGNPSPLLYKHRLYVIGGRGEIAVLDPATGAVKYQERISGIGACWASPWAYNDKIYFFDENGVTRVFKAGDTFELLPENRLEGKFWSSVAIAGDAYVFRGVEKLYCID